MWLLNLTGDGACDRVDVKSYTKRMIRKYNFGVITVLTPAIDDPERTCRRSGETQMGETEGRGEEKRLILPDLASMRTPMDWTANSGTSSLDRRVTLDSVGNLPGGWGRDWPGVVTPAQTGWEGGQKKWSPPSAGSRWDGELGSGLFRRFLCSLCSLLRPLLRGELLLHLGRDGLSVHLVGVGGIA